MCSCKRQNSIEEHVVFENNSKLLIITYRLQNRCHGILFLSDANYRVFVDICSLINDSLCLVQTMLLIVIICLCL